MKLLFLIKNFRQGWGGGPESVRLMARRLAPFGVSCDAYDRGFIHREIEQLELLPVDRENAEPSSISSDSHYSTILQVGPWQNPLHIQPILSRLAHRQHLYLPRGGLADIEFEGRRALRKKAYFPLIEDRNVNRANAIVFSSEAERRESTRIAGFIAEKVVIPDFFEWESPRPGGERRADQPLTFGFLGEISRRKGLLPLVEGVISWTEARDSERPVRLYVGGAPRPGSEAYLRHVKDLAARCHGVEVDFLGPVAHGDRNLFYSGIDVFVAPSLFESYGLIVLEALATGCAVISGPNLGVLEHLPAGLETEVLTDVSAAAIAEAVERATSRPPRTMAERLQGASRTQRAIEAINTEAARSWRALLTLE